MTQEQFTSAIMDLIEQTGMDSENVKDAFTSILNTMEEDERDEEKMS